MNKITITAILDDLRAADEITRRYERLYWLSSADFYDLYMQGLLDDGEHTDEFAEWSAFYQIKLDREAILRQLSQERVDRLKARQERGFIEIDPREPAIPLPAIR
ncbi:MAG: hypothetical protein ISS57_02540 [Anaerolineales bacterium]|nr:hypothetical protein [Chloroflexota bacterium]MBL7161456.1 hypothetical protein [Anaerolineales bacterium]